jgi:hypothetical protein
MLARVSAAVAAIAAASLILAGCGGTRVIVHRVAVKPCATVVAMSRCVTHISVVYGKFAQQKPLAARCVRIYRRFLCYARVEDGCIAGLVDQTSEGAPVFLESNGVARKFCNSAFGSRAG